MEKLSTDSGAKDNIWKKNEAIIMPTICLTILPIKHYYLLINSKYLHGKSNHYFTAAENNTTRSCLPTIPLQI